MTDSICCYLSVRTYMERESNMSACDRVGWFSVYGYRMQHWFNPPGSPHMGGAWERLVRSVKTALAAMESSRTSNEETLATLLVEAESVVNSRPLTYIPLETAQQEALTPNHFLLMSSSGVTQTPKTLTDPRQACRNDWNLCRTMVDQFWRRWVREYLPTIARRTKWFEETKPIEVGDSVIIVEEKIRNGWIRGRVAKVVVGRDGRVHDAVVQTPDGMVHRPVAKLARIDIEKVGLQPGTAEGDSSTRILSVRTDGVGLFKLRYILIQIVALNGIVFYLHNCWEEEGLRIEPM
ncbi:uncharacterized protein LOC131675865 [Topomyia yanbarensis]|uniref:uncharacterized protein LOC131675865 n=1 Tax=Topomyia yanbarensis TaxID=2498891 RepID=UPI00273B3994|nr:uncharacterized protein LOC131675865 [Topomyia yanbarensis]